LADRDAAETAASLLAPAQPYRGSTTTLRFRVARDGTAPSPDGIQRLLRRVDDAGVEGSLATVGSRVGVRATPPQESTLVESWLAAVAALPADWSDLVAELELDSSDYLERAAVLCVPLNPRRDGTRSAYRFRAAARFGYGASTSMVHRCLTRCDEEAIRGHVTVLRVLSDTRPVGTQGPVWLVAGRTV